MDQPHPQTFSTTQASPTLGPADAIEAALRTMGATGHSEIDGVAACELGDDGIWRIEVEVVESFARMGDNDLIAAYDVRVGEAGDVRSFRRLRRYFREDGPTG